MPPSFRPFSFATPVRFALACTALLSCHGAATPREGYLAGGGGARIFYRVTGEGSDTIVAMHGGPGGDMENIAPDLAPLHARHVVIYYDQRGGGRSELPADTTLLDIRYFVEDLEAVRQHFDLERMNILAHSFGPVMAAHYAQAHPDRVARLIFMGAIGPRRADAAAFGRTMYQRMDSATRDSTITLVQALINGTAADPVATCRAYEEMLRQADSAQGVRAIPKGNSCSAPPEAVKYANRYTGPVTVASLGKWDYTASLRGIAAPLLVIYGDRDPSPLSSQEAWASALPHGRLLVIPGAGHRPHVDRPDIVFPAIDSFLGVTSPP